MTVKGGAPIKPTTVRVRHRCRVHGITDGYVIAPKGRKPWVRCVKCQLDARRRVTARKRAASSQPGAAPGQFIHGLRTTYGLSTQRVILPIDERIWKWIENNHEKHGAAKSMLVNRLLSDRIAQVDPKFDPIE